MAGEMTIICKAKSVLASKKKIAIQRPWKQDEKTVTIIDGMKMFKTGVTAISQAPRSVARAKSNWF
jgi:translation initiation factor 1 (eIF-1/SUI1)